MKIILIYHTIKYLKLIQIYYQFYYRLKSRLKVLRVSNKYYNFKEDFTFNNVIFNKESFKKNKTFVFLNLRLQFDKNINWNESRYGKLWLYNLNYFDYLNQKNIKRKEGLDLINNFIQNYDILKEGKDPYPTSLRIINFIKFLGRNKVIDKKIINTLHKDTENLYSNIEYNLLGNHLLENGFALLFASVFFKSSKYFNKSIKILFKQLNEQILNDGGHFELSPMYHQILLFRLLDTINLFKNSCHIDKIFYQFLIKKTCVMLSFLNEITYNNGEIPMVNDSAYGIAPSSKELFDYADTLNISYDSLPLNDSGYRKIERPRYELFLDFGNIGPDYQPGHAHSDTFNFELYSNGKSIIVDTGTSTYEKNAKRQIERVTSSHNTVKIGDYEQSQVWGGFRVAERAKIVNLVEKENFISASHTGYKNKGFIHTRTFKYDNNQILIIDSISRGTNAKAKAYFHFSENMNPTICDKKLLIENENVIFEFDGAIDISKENYELAKGFNRTVNSSKVIITFNQKLKTKISL